MKVKFARNIHLEVVTDIIDDEPITKDEVFLAGETADFDIIDGAVGEHTQIEFGDGSNCFLMPSFWDNVIVESEENSLTCAA